MARIDIKTIPALRAAIRGAKEVFITVRFGVYESPVKISKSEALEIVRGANKNDKPEDWEMFGGSFAHLEGDTLYMG